MSKKLPDRNTSKLARARRPETVDEFSNRHAQAVVSAVDIESLAAGFSLADTEDVYRHIAGEMLARAAMLKQEDGR